MHRSWTFFVAAGALALAGCTGGVRWLGVRLLYDEVPAAGLRVWKSLVYQNRLLDAALREAGVPSRLVVIAGQSHGRMVLALSRGGTKPSTALVDFVRGSDCERLGRAAARGRID